MRGQDALATAGETPVQPPRQAAGAGVTFATVGEEAGATFATAGEGAGATFATGGEDAGATNLRGVEFARDAAFP
jgi:hypothetical protein